MMTREMEVKEMIVRRIKRGKRIKRERDQVQNNSCVTNHITQMKQSFLRNLKREMK